MLASFEKVSVHYLFVFDSQNFERFFGYFVKFNLKKSIGVEISEKPGEKKQNIRTLSQLRERCKK